jgi:hypothetical protein
MGKPGRCCASVTASFSLLRLVASVLGIVFSTLDLRISTLVCLAPRFARIPLAYRYPRGVPSISLTPVARFLLHPSQFSSSAAALFSTRHSSPVTFPFVFRCQLSELPLEMLRIHATAGSHLSARGAVVLAVGQHLVPSLGPRCSLSASWRTNLT